MGSNKKIILFFILFFVCSSFVYAKEYEVTWDWNKTGKNCNLIKSGDSYKCTGGSSLKLKTLDNVSLIKEYARDDKEVSSYPLQGGDIVNYNGTNYIYFGMISGNEGKGKIYRMSLNGKKLDLVTNKYAIGHMNDFAFNAKKGVITTTQSVLQSDGSYKSYAKSVNINGSKLASKEISNRRFNAITYDSIRDVYYAKSGRYIYTLDSDYNIKKRVEEKVRGNNTSQSWKYYNDLLYFCSCESGYASKYQKTTLSETGDVITIYNPNEAGSNLIYVWDLNGNLQWTYYIPNTKVKGEIENISFDDKGNGYIGYNIYLGNGKYKIAFYKFSLPKPSVTLSQASNEWINKNYSLNITTSDELGIRSLTVDGNKLKATSSNKYNKVISNNGVNKIKVVATNLANNQVSKTITVKIDKEKPIVSGITNNGKYVSAVTVKVKDSLSGIRSITLNGNNFVSGTKISEIGNYTLIATDNVGNSKTVKFEIIPKYVNSDVKVDEVISVSNVSTKLSNKNKKFTITLKPDIIINSIKVNNKVVNLVNNKYVVEATKNGSYKIEVDVPTNDDGNVSGISSNVILTKIVNVTNIDKSVPTISGVSNAKKYNTDVQLKVSDASGIKSLSVNGNVIDGTSYTASSSGNYDVVVTDNAGNSNSLSFTVNKETGIEHDVDSGNDSEDSYEEDGEDGDEITDDGEVTDPYESFDEENEVREVDDYSEDEVNEGDIISYEVDNGNYEMDEPTWDEEITNPKTGANGIVIIAVIAVLSMLLFYYVERKGMYSDN